MPHFSKVFRRANTVQKFVRTKRKPFDAETMPPIKNATPEEIFGSQLKNSKNKSKNKK
jgi:hypothetical protein